MFGILLKNKFHIILNALFKDTQQKKWPKLLGIAGSGFLFWFMLQWIQDIFQVMLQTNLLPGTISNRIDLFAGSITLIFNALFLFLFMGAISISVHHLYTAADLTLLLATPISLSAVFSFKILETIFVNTGIFFLIGGAILIGQGLLIDASPVYYLNMLIVGMFYISLPTMLAIFLTLGIVRLLPPQRVRELSSALTGLIGLGIWLLIQAFRFSLAEQANPALLSTQTEQILYYSRVSQQFWTPGLLVSNFTLYYLNPLIKPFPWQSATGLIIGCAILFWLCLNFSIRQYLNFGTIMNQTLLIKHARGKQIKLNSQRLPSFGMTLIWKDLRLIYRNPQLSIQFVIMMAMILFISLMMPNPQGEKILTVNMTESVFGYFFLLFIIVSAQNASRLIPLEGKAFWLMQILPAKMKQFLWSKFCLGFLINQTIAFIISGIITIYHQLSPDLFVHLVIYSILINLSATSIGILTGSYFPRFDWEHPKRMLTSAGALMVTGLSVLCFIFVMLLEFLFHEFVPDLMWNKRIMLITLLICGLILLEFILKASERKLVQLDLNI